MTGIFPVIAVLVGMIPCALAAEPIQAWKGGSGRGVRAEHLVMPLTHEEHYSDRYTFEAWFEDKTQLYVSILVSNFGAGTHKMTFKSRWTDTKGKNHRVTKKLKRKQYTVTGSPFSVEAAGHRVWGKPGRMHVKGQSGSHSYQITFSGGLRAWRPGTGRTTFGEDQALYLDTTLVAPKANVSGWVKHDGSKKSLSGYGYILHTHSNIAPPTMMNRFLEVRSIDGDTVVYMKRFVTPSRFGGKQFGYLYVARNGKVVGTSTRNSIRYGNKTTDKKHTNRYKVPLTLQTQTKRKNRHIDVRVTAPKVSSRKDPLKSLSALERVVAEQYTKPMNYSMDATVTVSVTEGDSGPVTSKEKGAYRVSHLNK
jgi:hypothetical protein